jgi:hypothetical protein
MTLQKLLLGFLIGILGLTTFGYVNRTSNDNDTASTKDQNDSQELFYYVHARNGKSVSPSTLINASSLEDIVMYYPSSWITNYDSVVVHTTNNGRQYSATSKDATLTLKQRKILSTADMFTDVVIYVKHKTTNAVTQEIVDEDISLKLYVRPETEAEYPDGIAGLQKFFKDNSEDKVAKLNSKMGFLAIVYFTINEEGRAEDIEISEYEEADAILRNLIHSMPTWSPAKDAEGNKVKQKFEFVFGYRSEKGC